MPYLRLRLRYVRYCIGIMIAMIYHKSRDSDGQNMGKEGTELQVAGRTGRLRGLQHATTKTAASELHTRIVEKSITKKIYTRLCCVRDPHEVVLWKCLRRENFRIHFLSPSNCELVKLGRQFWRRAAYPLAVVWFAIVVAQQFGGH